ncbi:3-hydroxyacyl-CoA dehydrogenase NAD-binding domain-containing protein [Siccirubricoccus deserti]
MARVAVIGAGTMGHALALVFALGGHRVRLTDSNEATLARAQGLMETALATLVAGARRRPTGPRRISPRPSPATQPWRRRWMAPS